MICPKCQSQLGLRATFCGCGWRKAAPAAQTFAEVDRAQCAHMGCFLSAKVRIQTRTGWADLCAKHYEQHFTDQALESLDRYGLAKEPDETNAEWVARMRNFVIDGVKKLRRNRSMERAAA